MLIDKQISLVSTLGIALKTVRRLCILMLGCKELNKFIGKIYMHILHTFRAIHFPLALIKKSYLTIKSLFGR